MFDAGDDVLVNFDGEELPGEVIENRGGWVLARVTIDPLMDLGSISARLSPQSLVMVRDKDVSPVGE